MSEVAEGFIEVREEYLFLASAALSAVIQEAEVKGMNLEAEKIALASIEALLGV
ncbi:hypothetical protein FQV37_2249 [Psychrobacter nivimaris]|uniref:Uncharacterized protein n=1 Tax=Psychrobacter nivimaris TaxID=281738 RepID=A0A6N7BWQ6_9GAMM|nr:hypothetical protein [Psychrobacter nivimaris]KAF0567393.1 hypothetical protein FQV37_2249 [Psychrobacter nivimaris]